MTTIEDMRAETQDAETLEDWGIDPRFGCPECGEQVVDMLVWKQDETGKEYVRCASCGFCYEP